MKIGPCVKENLGFLGCNRDVTSLMASKCSGRQSCEVSVQDQALHDSNPCSRDATYSLEVTYKCMSGRLQVHDKHSCISRTTGYLLHAYIAGLTNVS